MACRDKEQLKESVKQTIEGSEPAITLDNILEDIDADELEIIRVLEELQINGEIKQDILLWRGGDHSSISPQFDLR